MVATYGDFRKRAYTQHHERYSAAYARYTCVPCGIAIQEIILIFVPLVGFEHAQLTPTPVQ